MASAAAGSWPSIGLATTWTGWTGDVRLDAHLAVGLAVGRIELGRGQPHAGGGLFQGEDALHRALAEAPHADDRSPAMIADGAGENLRRAGAVLVDDHHQRHLPLALLVGRVGEVFLGAAAAGGDDDPALDEPIDHLDGRNQQAARIAADVDHQALHPLAVQLPQRGVEVAGGGFLEARELEISDSVLRVDDAHLIDAGHLDHAAADAQLRAAAGPARPA